MDSSLQTEKDNFMLIFLLLRVIIVEGTAMEGIFSIQLRYDNFCKQNTNQCPPLPFDADRQWSYHVERSATPQKLRERRLKRFIEVLPFTPHSALGTSTVAKPRKENLQSSFTFSLILVLYVFSHR
ncbi:hypothetical protein TNCV_4436401 [Trichonephila clavipes]|nr:hypothetical protein TNCV_4436401 [Trichonephila clavipes]